MIRKTLQAIIAITVLFVGYYKFSGSEYQKDLIVYGFVALATLTELLIEYVIVNRKRLGLIIYSKWLGLKRQRIRFSMSYLYRIKIDDKYLLVRNNNFGHYQLVGGKYKLLNDTRSFIQKEFDAIDDPKLPNKDLISLYLFQPEKQLNSWIGLMKEKIGRLAIGGNFMKS